MTDLDEPLAQALRDAVPQPPRELDPETIRTASAERPRRRLLAPVLAAAAVVAVAVGVLFAVHHQDARTGGPAGPVRDPAQITAQAVARLLAAAPTLPGATSIDHAPVRMLKEPMSTPGSPNLVRRTRWWTAPGSMAEAIAYFRAHPTAGTQSFGSSSANGPGRTARGLDFDAIDRRWLRPTVYTQLKLRVTVAPALHGVGIRLDAEAVWLPQRTPAEQIPPGVTSVDVVVDRPDSAPTVRRTLNADDAQALAALVNRQPVFPPGVRFCPIDRGWTDTLTFRTPQGVVRVDAEADGCGPLSVGPRSEHNPTLSGGWAVDHALLKALGLPANYGN